MLVKWDAAGNLAWSRSWGGLGDDSGRSVRGDGTSVYTCGYTDSSGAGSGAGHGIFRIYCRIEQITSR